MDACFEVPGLGWRFGLNTILDLVPGIGDAATSLIAFGIVVSAAQRGVPRILLVRMALNVAIYAVVGIIPWLGDLVDTWFKPNMRNMALLRRHAESATYEPEHRRADTLFVWGLLGGLAVVLIASTLAVFWILSRMAHLFGF